MKKIVPFIPVALLLFLIYLPSCQKDLSLESGNDSLLTATGSLKDSFGSCLPDTLYGTFYNGITPGSDTAFIEIKVQVDQTGSYVISSDQQNGMLFSDSGFFVSTGVNVVRLKPIGTPILPIPTVYTVNFDTSVCTYVVTVKDSTGTGLGGQDTTVVDTTLQLDEWRFTASDSLSFAGVVSDAFFDTSLFNMLSVNGVNDNDSTILINIQLPNKSIDTGTYITEGATGFYFSEFAGTPIYRADATTQPDGIMTIIITAYDSVTRIVEGSFSGTAEDVSGNSVVISAGSFKATVR